MEGITLDDLAAIAPPDIIESIDYETLLSGAKADFLAYAEDFGLDYDVADLETDPGVVLLQEASYKEVLLRARGNDIARARYLYFATGTAVDHLGAFYDCPRLVGEADDRYKLRIVLAIQGRSTGGTEPRYRAVALAASLRVAAAKVYRVGKSPLVTVSVFASDNDGVADSSLLTAVHNALNDPAVIMVNDTISVRAAVVSVVNVAADVWLLPSADESLLAGLPDSIRTQWATESGLGRDLTHSWLIAKLMVLGMARVVITAPASDRLVTPYEAVRIGTVTLTNRGGIIDCR